MRLGRVLGNLVAEIRHPDLAGYKLLWVEGLNVKGESTGKRELAVDCVDAGAGDKVLIFDEGNGAAQILKRSRSAIRTVIVGVVDEVDQT